MNPPLISVLMPVYNGEKFILPSIQSILCQSYKWFELLICDDGSTDNTLHILKQVKDPRVKVFRNAKNMNVSFTRNFLLGKAQGEFIAHQDSDDVSYPDRLEKLWKFLDSSGLVFTCCSNRILGKPTEYHFETNRMIVAERMLRFEKCFAGNNCMYHRKVIDVGIHYDVALACGEDVLFEAEIQANFPNQMQAVKEVMYLYRKRADSLTIQNKLKPLVPKEAYLARNAKIKNLLTPLVSKEKP